MKVRYEAQPSTNNLRVGPRPAPAPLRPLALRCISAPPLRARRLTGAPAAPQPRRPVPPWCVRRPADKRPPPSRLLHSTPPSPQAAARLELVQLEGLEPPEADAADDDIWPLQLVDLGDASQLDVLHALLGGAAPVVQHYLDAFIFPEAMHFQQTKLSASGQVCTRTPVQQSLQPHVTAAHSSG